MQTTLIYNPNSGGNGIVNPEELLKALEAAGYQTVYEPTETEDDLDRVLDRKEGLVVIVGGDGAVRAVVTRILDRPVPLALIPAGTANNIAAALGIKGKPLEIVSGLKTPIRAPFNVGRCRAPWGVDYFLEAAGYGLYAAALAAYNPEDGKSLLRSIEAITETLGKMPTEYHRLRLDGQDISGEYMILEVMNTAAYGPRIKANPEADPGDDRFEIIRIKEDKRFGALDYIQGLLKEDLQDFPNVEISRGRKLEVIWNGFPVHIDGEVRPPGYKPPEEGNAIGETDHYESDDWDLIFDIMPKSIEFWLPPAEAEKNSDDR
jgi:diacylglycerol kinase family enzyme